MKLKDRLNVVAAKSASNPWTKWVFAAFVVAVFAAAFWFSAQ